MAKLFSVWYLLQTRYVWYLSYLVPDNDRLGMSKLFSAWYVQARYD